jgi:Fic family protein
LAELGDTRRAPLTDEEREHFTFALPDAVQRLLRVVDQRCAGDVAIDEVMTADERAKYGYLVKPFLEEAIRSGQLAGATTSHRAAKELLLSGRAPEDRSERMVLNTYRALLLMREETTARLTPELVLRLQRTLTEGTSEEPPPAAPSPDRLLALCAFANEDDGEQSIHPVVRGILLHRWLAYDRPFAEGNRRTGRALFLWHLRTRGYSVVEYLSISRVLCDAPSEYARSCRPKDTDEHDTTSFLLYQLEVVERALDELREFLRRKVERVRDVEQLVQDAPGFTYRDVALLSDALRHAERTYTVSEHAATHRVTEETARADLAALVDHRLLDRSQRGGHYRYAPAVDLADRLRRIAAGDSQPRI